MIREIKRWLRTSPLTKWIYQKLYNMKHMHEERSANQALKTVGAQVLADFKALMEAIGADWYLAYGTCLGALRSGQFIGHDTDMDFYLCPKTGGTLADVNAALAAAGYKHHHDYEVDGEAVESSYEKNGVHFDIFVLEEKPEGFGCYLFNRFPEVQYSQEYEYTVSLSRAPSIVGTREIELAGVSVPIPANAKEFMELYYGDQWLTPDPDFSWQNSLSSRVRTKKFGYYKDHR